MPDEVAITPPETPPIEEEPEEPVFRCPDCDEEHSTEDAAEECCRPYACPDCGERYAESHDADTCCGYVCEGCGERHDYREDAETCCRGGSSYYPTLRLVTPYWIKVEQLPLRPARLVSVEQEITSGGAAAANMLYEADLGEYRRICDYSHQPDPGSIAVCEDGSLPSDGGEIKYSRFDLSDPGHIDVFSTAVTKIRQLHKEAGIVDVGSAAGMHIHHAARDETRKVLSPVAMVALHELFSHGEDMIYGLAAAGWRNHRYGMEGNDYAKPIPKLSNSEKSPWKVSRIMGSKYFGVNFERLLEGVHRCSCGSAKFGDWSECECHAFDSATVEWRVFNTSTRPETIHAWILFSGAMMAYADRHTPGTLPDNPYRTTDALSEARRSARCERLGWFLKRLPLTQDEKEVIRGVAMTSPLFTRQTRQEGA